MSMKHTQEPWCIPPGDLIFVSKVGGRGYVAKMMPLDAPRDRKGLPTDTSDEMCANARRIVACVNACRGLSNDELEQKGIVTSISARFLAAERSRDELLAALEVSLAAMEHMGNVLNEMDAVTEEDEVHYAAFEQARTAIAKAKGGAA
ncbi:hypothetical protein [Aeromonas veronii]|uniref:hypothetical protein n=1 Tax=Aeromonas veronii TaxID=654 RepID=UPI00111A312E|nr:hypothetical protein [Aeromonas veronii]TNI35693.1 hypothetical protein CF128_15385 [Aeromonas veronii]